MNNTKEIISYLLDLDNDKDNIITDVYSYQMSLDWLFINVIYQNTEYILEVAWNGASHGKIYKNNQPDNYSYIAKNLTKKLYDIALDT